MTDAPVISDAVVEAALISYWKNADFKWPASFNENYQADARRRMRAAITAAVLAELEAATCALPSWWRPSKMLEKAVEDYERIKADLADFDGDRRGIAAALTAAESRIVGALRLNVSGDDDDDMDYHLIRACASIIVAAIRARSTGGSHD